jgi:acetyl esterase/lipase
VIGDLSTAEPTARSLASRSGAVVVCVEYRKAPEHALDDAYDDGVAAVRWVQANATSLHIDGTRIGVGGDSAGGNVAAVVAQEHSAAAPERPLAVQLLVYPSTSGDYEPARARNAAGGTLDTSAMHWFETHIAGATDPDSQRYAPVLTEDLSGLPTAIIVTAGWDPLRDEGITYLDRLREAGVRAEHLHYHDDVHGFFTMDLLLPNGTDALNRAAAALVEILGLEHHLEHPIDTSPAAVLRRGIDSRVRELRVRIGYLTEEAVHRQLRLQRWLIRTSGLPAGRDVEALHTRITRLENELRGVRRQLDAEQQRGGRRPNRATSVPLRARAK